jgi:hypothetical protein
MKYTLPLSFAALLLVACGDLANPDLSELDAVEQVDVSPTALPDGLPAALNADDKVLVMVERLVSEDNACLVMMSIANGTDETVTAGLFAFDVTGNGETAGANMFPQTTEPDTMAIAQIVLPGADCANVQRIEGGQLNCKIADTGESCLDASELRDGVVDFTAND